MVSNKQVIFAKVPSTYPVAGEHMQVRESTIDLNASLPEGDFLVKTLVLSVDPYLRGRMRDASTKSYIDAFALDQPMSGFTMSVVVKSNNPDFKVDDLVYSPAGEFVEYMHVPKTHASVFEVRNDARTSGLSITNYVGVLGMPGMTAYVGLKEIGKPKKGETLYVSAASGAVGQLVGQIGKMLGLTVVGSAGSDEKVNYLKEIGFDGAFNYKTEDIDQKLEELCPHGIDVYFESVGGKMLEAVIRHANNFARIVACGMVSQYNLTQPESVNNLLNIVTKRLTIQGFVVFDYNDKQDQFRKEMTGWLQSKKIKYQETVAEGIDSTPQALVDVLKGKNFGKQVVKVSEL